MARRKRQRKTKVVVPVASMGDIAFLLIIFFVLASNFAKENYPLVLPSGFETQDIDASPIRVGIDETGQVWVNGRVSSSADGVQYEVAALIEQRRQGASPDDDDQMLRLVIFKCDKRVDRKVFEPVLMAITRAGGVLGAVGEGPQGP